MANYNNYRGKGTSRDKVCKGTNIPKHSGNYSYSTIHHQSLQSKDYHVRLKDGKLIVGDHTPLTKIFPAELVQLALTDENFKLYCQTGTHTHGGKQYEANRSLSKFNACGWHTYLDYQFTLRVEIYTDGDFEYTFPDY